jgi:hypothetical protein
LQKKLIKRLSKANGFGGRAVHKLCREITMKASYILSKYALQKYITDQPILSFPLSFREIKG